MATNKLTRFEKARLLGARALQLSMGAKPLVKVSESIDPIDIAALELENKVLPLDVKKMNIINNNTINTEL
uniref:DNA-directed RNA polymerase subunit K n=1 Tax=Methanobrevibacter arboriphilus TaxID=39441 RepID=UPI0009EC57CF